MIQVELNYNIVSSIPFRWHAALKLWQPLQEYSLKYTQRHCVVAIYTCENMWRGVHHRLLYGSFNTAFGPFEWFSPYVVRPKFEPIATCGMACIERFERSRIRPAPRPSVVREHFQTT
jgi:hypothetical protein